MENQKHRLWKGKTGGQQWMHKCLIAGLRYLSVKPFYWIMACVIPFYMLINHSGYIAIYHYFRYRFHWGILKSFRYVYLNHYRFGQIILDRFAVYAGQRFNFVFEADERFVEDCGKESGLMILSSHVGNYELAGYSLSVKNKSFNVVGYFDENATIMSNKTAKFEQNNIHIIPVKEDMSHIFALNKALMDGQIVSLPSDRIFGSVKSISCLLLGKDADFPRGPFAIAAQRDVPVYEIFIMKESAHGYRAIIRRLEKPSSADCSRQEIEQSLAKQYARNLGEVLERYPEQWFNFYDFWSDRK